MLGQIPGRVDDVGMRSAARRLVPKPIQRVLRTARDRFRYAQIGLQKVNDVQTTYFGTEYGGHAVPDGALGSDSVCFCFGAGEDISFEEEISRRLDCETYIFDPTPRAPLHCGPRVATAPRLHFHSLGVWSSNDTLKFYAPAHKEHVSHSILNMNRGAGHYFEAPCRTPRTLMSIAGVNHLDLVKLNIEGAEYEVLNSLFSENLAPRLVCMTFDEMHSPVDAGAPNRMRKAVKDLLARGYSPIFALGAKVTFFRARESRPISEGTGA